MKNFAVKIFSGEQLNQKFVFLFPHSTSILKQPSRKVINLENKKENKKVIEPSQKKVKFVKFSHINFKITDS